MYQSFLLRKSLTPPIPSPLNTSSSQMRRHIWYLVRTSPPSCIFQTRTLQSHHSTCSRRTRRHCTGSLLLPPKSPQYLHPPNLFHNCNHTILVLLFLKYSYHSPFLCSHFTTFVVYSQQRESFIAAGIPQCTCRLKGPEALQRAGFRGSSGVARTCIFLVCLANIKPQLK